MVDEFKSIRENLFKVLSGFSVSVSGVSSSDDDDDQDSDRGDTGPSRRSRGSTGSGLDPRAARDLLAAIFMKAGKGKDEIVQIVAREIGTAVAHMLKAPLSQLAKHQKLQISFELVPKVPKNHGSEKRATEPTPEKTSKPSSKSTQRKASTKSGKSASS